jgi:hypothetical protein
LKVPPYLFGWSYVSWLSFTPDYPEEEVTEVTITMSSTGTEPQQVNLSLYLNMSDGQPSSQITCTLLNEE